MTKESGFGKQLHAQMGGARNAYPAMIAYLGEGPSPSLGQLDTSDSALQLRKHHILSATMDVIAKTLKDYADLKVARMEVSQILVRTEPTCNRLWSCQIHESHREFRLAPLGTTSRRSLAESSIPRRQRLA